jgi:hypothetical protein
MFAYVQLNANTILIKVILMRKVQQKNKKGKKKAINTILMGQLKFIQVHQGSQIWNMERYWP